MAFSQHEGVRDRRRQIVADLGERANDNTGRLAGAVRQVLMEARGSLDAAATDSELREAIERWVGPMTLRPDGAIA